MFTSRFVFVLLYLMSMVMTGGCSSTKPVVAPVPSCRPAWVEQGSGAFSDEKDTSFYGVASAWNIKNPSLLRSTADNRARAELSRIFKIYTASLMKDYSASTMAGDPDETGEEQHAEQTIKTFSKAVLAGVQIVDHYKDSETGELFSLARMDLEAFENFLSQSTQMSESARKRLIQHAREAFEDLAKEEAKYK